MVEHTFILDAPDDIMQDHIMPKLMEHPSFELITSSNNTWRMTTPTTQNIGLGRTKKYTWHKCNTLSYTEVRFAKLPLVI